LKGGGYRCRLVASSFENSDRLSKRHKFSEELYHQLSVIQIKIPSLSERKDDFPLLVKDLVAEISLLLRRNKATITETAIEKLSARNWPGNITELKNFIFFALNNAKNSEITDDDVPSISNYSFPNGASLNDELYRISAELIGFAKDRGIYNAAAEYERLLFPPLFKAALDAAGNNKTKAAKLLGINRNTLRIKLDGFGKQNN
jgi:DNA-binding NtrC family response regulator